MEEQKTVFVICHTVFHDTLRSGAYKDTEAIESFKKFLRARFMLDVLIEVSAEERTGSYTFFTSKKVFDLLSAKLAEEGTPEGVKSYIMLLRNMIYVVENERVNKLEENEGVIVIADTLSNREDYAPVIITGMGDGKSKRAKEYYKKETGEEDPSIPFRILSLEEAVGFFEATYPEQCKYVKQRDTAYNIVY